MNASFEQSIRYHDGLKSAYRTPQPKDYLVQGGRKLGVPISQHHRPCKRDRISSKKAESSLPLNKRQNIASPDDFIVLGAKNDPSIEVMDLTDDDGVSASMTPEKLIVFDTFATMATDVLKGNGTVELLSDDASIGTFEVSVGDNSSRGGTMDWEMLQDTFEDPSIVAAPQGTTPEIMVTLHDEKQAIVEAPEDELNWDDDLFLEHDDGDNHVDNVIELEAMFSNTFAHEPSAVAAAPREPSTNIVTVREDGLDWNEELVSLEDFNSGLIVGTMDGATLVDIFDEPSTIETDAFAATLDNEAAWDDQLAFLGSHNEYLISPWENGTTSTVTTPSSVLSVAKKEERRGHPERVHSPYYQNQCEPSKVHGREKS